MFNPRPGQIEIAKYSGGMMGVSAVPGSGKTHTLSYLAAKLVADEKLAEDQEILIVTLVNSAVDNFASRIALFLKEMGLIPGVGYRVRTLHGLAYDIVREHPDFVGLDNHFTITDERTSMEILNSSVRSWIHANPEFLEGFTHENTTPAKHRRNWQELIQTTSTSFIKQAKDYQISPEFLKIHFKDELEDFPLLKLGYEIYSNYQRALTLRGSVDFEDLIRFAYRILKDNPDYLERIQHRWPVILEDEAQDSSMIQEKLLSMICREEGNWVRVGDPNQAIFETFTTADPELLRDFISEPHVIRCDLKHSGRSTQSIMDLANYLISWSLDHHPVPEIRGTLDKPFIHPTLKNDLQQNPKDDSDQIFLWDKANSPENEVEVVANSIKNWLENNIESTAAVLVPRNQRGAELAELLEKIGVPYIEHLKSTQSTRDTARILGDILHFLVDPISQANLAGAIKAILKGQKIYEECKDEIGQIIHFIKKNLKPEELVSNESCLQSYLNDFDTGSECYLSFIKALDLIKRWQYTALLPIDQIIMTISMELFYEPAELALAHKLAVVLKSTSSLNPHSELPDFRSELDMIAKNRFRLYGFSDDDLGFNPDDHKGEVVISTIHKAKGLEWDRVYIMSVNNYDFPSGQDYDSYISEKWFIRDELNLEAELIAQLEALIKNDRILLNSKEGTASKNARIEYCAERLRLLYVGITRARKELVITWNTGRRDDRTEAVPLQALRRWWEETHAP